MKLIQVTPEEFTTLVNEILDSKIEILLNHLQQTPKTEYLSKKETAKLLRVSIGTLDNWSKNGILEPIHIGNKVLYTRQAIDNKLAS